MSKHPCYSLALVILLLVACINPTAAYTNRMYNGFDPAVGNYTINPHGLVFQDINHISSVNGNVNLTSDINPCSLFANPQPIDFSTFTRPVTQPETQAHKPVTVAPIVVMGVATAVTDGEVTAIIFSSTAIVGAISMKHPELMDSLWDACTALIAMYNAAVLFISSDVSTQTNTTYGVTLEMSKAGTQQCTDAIHRFDYPTDKEKGLPVEGNNKETTGDKIDDTLATPYSSQQLFMDAVDRSNGCPKQIRYYGKDGKKDMDIDFYHAVKAPDTIPHKHIWKDGVRGVHDYDGIQKIIDNWKCKNYDFKNSKWK